MAQVRLDLGDADGKLPQVCMKCGAPATATVAKTMAWRSPWLLLLNLAHPVTYLLFALIMTRRAHIQAPFCDAHQAHWRNRSWVIWGTFVPLVLVPAAGITIVAIIATPKDIEAHPIIVYGFVILLVVWIIILFGVNVCSTTIHATSITTREIWIDGVAEEFVEAVAEVDRQRRARIAHAIWGEEEYEAGHRERPSEAIEEESRSHRKPPPSNAIEED